MPVSICDARVVVIAPTQREARDLARSSAGLAHALPIGAIDPDAFDKLRGRTVAGWAVSEDIPIRWARRVAEVVEFAQRRACRCVQHFPAGVKF